MVVPGIADAFSLAHLHTVQLCAVILTSGLSTVALLHNIASSIAIVGWLLVQGSKYAMTESFLICVDLNWFMLIYVDFDSCWLMLIYVDLCWFMWFCNDLC